ncbi:YbbR-like domain-containing protein [Convivina intestini]|uniref:YbbR domain-containing protein n=1 Tax=Convivina intestini TaxID=1505726 RepID=A0A2U1DC85_9LACO|nr:CdaR family protein [Convivina intestini]PVY85271.1 YbbR domain-containing protein [Convivina intestini]CAH1852696.1 CdaA regulatory protein CdaR [Convivina intestini]SDB86913.1 YbbR domain-containing protein [Leuconostocaceae bacterium R-53105]
MNKWTNSKILNLIFSLFLAVLLSAYVLSTQSASRNGNNEFTSILPEKKINLTVPLNLQYNNDEYVVVGAPTSVSLAVHGPAALVTTTQSHNDIQAVADLRDLGVGQHTVKLAVKGVNSALTSTVSPQTVNVTIAKKTSEKRKIKINYDDSKLAQGYSVVNSVINPKTVTVSGPKSNVDAVDHVTAEVELAKDTKTNVNQTVKLVAYDRNGTLVEVQLSNRTAEINLTVNNSDASKKVDLVADPSDGDANNFSITLGAKTVTIYGASDTLSNVDQIKVPVDLSQITEKTTLHVDLPKQQGINRYSESTVEVTVTPK